MEEIYLNDLLNISNESDDFRNGKITFNGNNNLNHWLSKKNSGEIERCSFALWPFNSAYKPKQILKEGILEIIAIQLDRTDRWLLANIVRINKVYDYAHDKTQVSRYCEAEVVEKYRKFCGRVIFRLHKNCQGYNFTIRRFLNDCIIEKILPKEYGGIPFPGYNNLCIKMRELMNYLNNSYMGEDWKSKLSSIKAIYCLNNHDENKVYIGSAYNNKNCLLSRWEDYFDSYHGNNKELIELRKKHKNDDYFLDNFYFSILETFSIETDKNYIIEREHHWMKVFNSRNSKQGYNKN